MVMNKETPEGPSTGWVMAVTECAYGKFLRSQMATYPIMMIWDGMARRPEVVAMPWNGFWG